MHLFPQHFSDWLQQFVPLELYQALFALLADKPWYVLDKTQQIKYCSPGLLSLLDYETDEFLVQRPAPPGLELDFVGLKRLSSATISNAAGIHIPVDKTASWLSGQDAEIIAGICLLTPRVDSPQEPSKTINKPNKDNFHGIISRSPAMHAVFQIIENAAATTATVLVRGESGSGKELVARAIHQLSTRNSGPFLAINCAALSSSLLESELFGHVRGAFTGAVKDHSGLFQRANGGTLFLDEVAELPLELQAKLLRVLQERNYIPVGGDRSISVDVRIVAATHRSLREQVRLGEFREDLMYRLRVVPIFIPPLRERREDINLLLWHFIRLHNAENFRRIEKIDPAAMQILLDYAWPGNVRELHNVVEYAFAVGRGTVLRSAELPPEFRELPRSPELDDKPLALLSPEQEADAIRAALARYQGKLNLAANALGMSRATFWRKRKLYGL